MALAVQGTSGRVSEVGVVAETQFHWFLAPDTTPLQGTRMLDGHNLNLRRGSRMSRHAG